MMDRVLILEQQKAWLVSGYNITLPLSEWRHFPAEFTWHGERYVTEIVRREVLDTITTITIKAHAEE